MLIFKRRTKMLKLHIDFPLHTMLLVLHASFHIVNDLSGYKECGTKHDFSARKLVVVTGGNKNCGLAKQERNKNCILSQFITG